MALAQVVRFQFLAQVEVDVRVAVAPAVQLRDQPARAEGRRGRHSQHFGLAAVGKQEAGGQLYLLQDASYLGQVQLAGRGQLQALAHPAEQGVLQLLLELRDLLAHGALGQAQLFGGAGEAQVPGYRFEALQGGHRRQAAFVQHGGFPGAGGAGGTRYMNKRNDVGRKARLPECRATLITAGKSRDRAFAGL